MDIWRDKGLQMAGHIDGLTQYPATIKWQDIKNMKKKKKNDDEKS